MPLTMNDPVKTWEDISNQLGENPILLLGNGASIAVSPSHFQYGSICDEVSNKLKGNSLKEFKNARKIKGNDLEEILTEFESNKKTYKQIRMAFIDFMTDNHPSYMKTKKTNPNDTEIDNHRKIGSFIADFSHIFTTNYDVIIYWSIFESGLIKKEDMFKDFFTRPIDPGSTPKFHSFMQKNNCSGKSLCYLHGSIFLFKTTTERCKKIVSDKDNKKSLLEVIRETISKNKVNRKRPCHIQKIVFEGNSKSKEEKIKSNEYLKNSLNQLGSLGSLNGSIVIYGSSLSDNDNHIWNKIKQNKKINKVFISVMREKLNSEEINRLKKLFPKKEVILFDATSKGCWIY